MQEVCAARILQQDFIVAGITHNKAKYYFVPGLFSNKNDINACISAVFTGQVLSSLMFVAHFSLFIRVFSCLCSLEFCSLVILSSCLHRTSCMVL